VARAALLNCAHYLPVGRARDLLEALTAIDVSTGFLAGIRGRAARRLEKKFLGHMQNLLAGAPVLHADETPGRAAGALSYVHVACTEYLTLMHVGDRSAVTLDAGKDLASSPGYWCVMATPATSTYRRCTPGAEPICFGTCGRFPTPIPTGILGQCAGHHPAGHQPCR
jgi:transposase IS66 family protein